jgi:hypothetical protein
MWFTTAQVCESMMLSYGSAPAPSGTSRRDDCATVCFQHLAHSPQQKVDTVMKAKAKPVLHEMYGSSQMKAPARSRRNTGGVDGERGTSPHSQASGVEV